MDVEGDVMEGDLVSPVTRRHGFGIVLVKRCKQSRDQHRIGVRRHCASPLVIRVSRFNKSTVPVRCTNNRALA